jgi:hypothetical protein
LETTCVDVTDSKSGITTERIDIDDAINSLTLSAPAVTSVSPTNGSTAGGNTVTINGSNLLGATTVNFGPTPAASFTIVSDTQITAVAPARPAGLVNIYVTVPGGTNPNQPSSWYQFKTPGASPPTVSSVSPANGPTNGGNTVNLTGTNFTGTTSVKFGQTPATGFTVNNDTSITATAPAHAAGLVNVNVTNGAGTNPNQSSSWYTYNVNSAPPTVSSVSPKNGPAAGGTLVTINGTGFTGATAVRFSSGTPAASFTIVNDGKITVTAPPHAAGLVNIFVDTPLGTNPNQSSSWYTYT